MLAVSAIANFSNFFQNIAALIQKAKESLDIATLAVAFSPPPEVCDINDSMTDG